MIQSFQDGDGEPLRLLDEMFAAMSAYFLFTRDLTQSLNFSLVVRGGSYDGSVYADTTITLGASTTTYVEANLTTHAITSNTTGYTSGRLPIGIAVTNSVGLTSWQQDFPYLNGLGAGAPAPAPSPAPAPAPAPGPAPAPAPAGADPSWSNVVLALHGDGSDGSTTIVDSKSAQTPDGVYLGSVAISTAHSKFGGASIKFPNAGGLVYANTYAAQFDFGTGDFCLRAWVYFDGDATNSHVIFDSRSAGGDLAGLVFYISATGVLSLYSGTTTYYTGGSAFPVNTWTHVAVTRASGTLRIFQGGAVMVSSSFAATLSSGQCAIGDVTHSYSNPTATFSGYLDDVEVVKGEAVYTAAYTPPTAAFPNS